MSKCSRLLVGAASIGVSASMVSFVQAQEASLAIEEIIVSARKTEENSQDIPIALEAFSAKTITEKGIEGVEDVADLSASLTFDTGLLPNDTRPVIRGLSSTRGRANVATLIDDVDVTSEALTTGGGGITGNLRLMDLERVEIVKGPQSVLYGRSAFTGAINYVTKRPSQEFGGSVSVDVDEHDSLELKLGLTGPITDTLAARINLASWDSDGWYESNNGGDLNGGNNLGGSLALEWIPNDTFSAFTYVTYSDEEYDPRAIVLRRSMINSDNGNKGAFGTGVLAPGAEALPYAFDDATIAACNADGVGEALFAEQAFGPACRPYPTGEMSASEDEVDYSLDPRTGKDFRGTELENARAHLDLRWEFDSFEFRSISAYTKNTLNTQEDFDQTDYSLVALDPGDLLTFAGLSNQVGLSAAGNITHEVEQFSQEFRFVGYTEQFDWFVSALFWQEKMNTTWKDRFYAREGGDDLTGFMGSPGPIYVDEPDYDLKSTNLSRETDHWSLAASGTWHITSALSLTLEGRYLEEELTYAGDNEDIGAYTLTGGVFCDFMFTPADQAADKPCGTSYQTVTNYEFVPRANLSWQFTDQTMAYLTYAEGFKPSGVDTTAASGDVSGDPFESEEVKTYELGFKTSWLDNSLFVNGAVFYYDYTNQQVGVTAAPPGGGVPQSKVVNAGESSLVGFETNIAYRITENWQVDFGYVLADSEYDDYNLQDIAQQIGPGFNVTSSNNLAAAGNAEGDFSGNQLPLSAKHSATLGIRYDQMLSQNLNGFVDLYGKYQSKRYLDDSNRAWLPSHQVWDFQLGLEAEQWTAILYVDNLFDDDEIKSGLMNTDYGFQPDAQNLSRAASLALPQPRTLGLRLRYEF